MIYASSGVRVASSITASCPHIWAGERQVPSPVDALIESNHLDRLLFLDRVESLEADVFRRKRR